MLSLIPLAFQDPRLAELSKSDQEKVYRTYIRTKKQLPNVTIQQILDSYFTARQNMLKSQHSTASVLYDIYDDYSQEGGKRKKKSKRKTVKKSKQKVKRSKH
jgi:hypothetical protein